jgi:CBS domain-containing protein
MSAPALTVKPGATIDELRRLFAEYEYNGLPVVSDLGVLQGIVAKRDLFKLELQPYPDFIPPLDSTWVPSVGAIMSSSVITLYPVEPAIRAMALMVDYRIRTIPGVSDAAGGGGEGRGRRRHAARSDDGARPLSRTSFSLPGATPGARRGSRPPAP